MYLDGVHLLKEGVNGMVDWLPRIDYEESMISDIGRACLVEIGYKSRWWER